MHSKTQRMWIMAGSAAALTALGAAGLAVGTNAPAAPEPNAKPAMLEAATYGVDSGHSSVIFRVKHVNVAYQYGRFNDPKGEFRFDPETGALDAIDISVMTDAVDTNSPGRDKHLRSPDFFSAKEFPVISFESKSIEPAGVNKLNATGTLKMHGKTKEITVPIEITGHGQGPRGSNRAGFHTEFTIKRSEFGITYGIGGIGDEVTLLISIEGIQKG